MSLNPRVALHHLSGLWQRLWPELRKTWPAFVFVGGPLLAIAIGRTLGTSRADQVLYAGTALQIFGILLVAWGVREVRRDFGRPSVFAAMRDRVVAIVHGFKPREHRIISGTGHITLGGAAVLGYGRVRGTVEQRLDGLENEIDALRKDVDQRERTFDNKIAEVEAALAKEKQARAAANADISRKLENVAVGGLYMEVMGLWWLLFATFATSIPQEIAKLF